MPTANRMVKFIPCLRGEYDDLTTKDNDTLYFITNECKIYVGSDEYTKSIRILNGEPTIQTQGLEGVIYYCPDNYSLYIVHHVTTNVYGWTRISNLSGVDTLLPLLVSCRFNTQSFIADNTTYYCYPIRNNDQLQKDGLADVSIADIIDQINQKSMFDPITGTSDPYQREAMFLKNICYFGTWAFQSAIEDIVNVEETSTFALWDKISTIISNTQEEFAYGRSVDMRMNTIYYASGLYATVDYVDTAIDSNTPKSLYLQGQYEHDSGGGVYTYSHIMDVSYFETGMYANELFETISNASCGKYANLVFYTPSDGSYVGYTSVPLFASVVPDANDQNATYMFSFQYFNGSNMCRATFTGSAEDEVVFTIPEFIIYITESNGSFVGNKTFRDVKDALDLGMRIKFDVDPNITRTFLYRGWTKSLSGQWELSIFEAIYDVLVSASGSDNDPISFPLT